MPKKEPQSSSSSSSEDLTAFQSVAVSFEDITSKQKEVAEKAKQRLSGTRTQKRERKQRPPGEDGDGGEDEDDGHAAPSDQLDPIQLKVAVALDSLLDGRLRHKEPGPKRRKKEAKAAARAEAEGEAGGDFRFFARVQPGTAVVLEPEEAPLEQGTPFPETFRQRRQPPAEVAAAALPALAVDGEALLATAGQAGQSEAHAGQQHGGAKDKGRQAGSGGKAQAWKPNRQFGTGQVLDPPPFVPYDERMRRLVGSPA